MLTGIVNYIQLNKEPNIYIDTKAQVGMIMNMIMNMIEMINSKTISLYE